MGGGKNLRMQAELEWLETGRENCMVSLNRKSEVPFLNKMFHHYHFQNSVGSDNCHMEVGGWPA